MVRNSYSIIMDATNRVNNVNINTEHPIRYAETIVRKLGHENIKFADEKDIIKQCINKDTLVFHRYLHVFNDDSVKILCDGSPSRAIRSKHVLGDKFEEMISDNEHDIICEKCEEKMKNWMMILTPYLKTLNGYILKTPIGAEGIKSRVSTDFKLCALVNGDGNIIGHTTSDASLKSKLVSLESMANSITVYECVPNTISDDKSVLFVLHNELDGEVFKSLRIVKNKKGVERKKYKFHTYDSLDRATYNQNLKPNTKVVGYVLTDVYGL